MFEVDILNDCLVELPPFGSFPTWSFTKVDSPVRLVEAVDSVYDGNSLEGPVAGIYRVVYMTGEAREILTRGDPLHTDFDSSVFLKDGRTTDQLRDIVRLIVPGTEGVVPDAIKDALRKYEADRDISMGSVSSSLNQPIRSIECVESVYTGKGLMDGPVGLIYRADFLDGQTREIFVEGDPLHRDFASAVFLRPGRKGDRLKEVAEFMIPGSDGAVPASIKDALRKYEAGRDSAAKKLSHG